MRIEMWPFSCFILYILMGTDSYISCDWQERFKKINSSMSPPRLRKLLSAFFYFSHTFICNVCRCCCSFNMWKYCMCESSNFHFVKYYISWIQLKSFYCNPAWSFHWPVLILSVFPGGFRISPVRHSSWDTGSDLKRDQEALLRPLIQSGPELHRRGLGHCEGGLKAEGNDKSLIP